MYMMAKKNDKTSKEEKEEVVDEDEIEVEEPKDDENYEPDYRLRGGP